MSRQHTTSPKTAKIWQRHALAQACFMLAAGISSTAWAVDVVYTPGAAMSSTNATLGANATVDATQSAGAYWSTGYNAQIRNYQLGTGQISGVMTTNSLFSSLTGAGSTPVSLNANNLMMYAYGNQNSNANLALNTLTAASTTDDGQLALNLQIFSGLATDGIPDSFVTQSVLATATNTSLYITQAGKSPAALSLTSNNLGATLALNTVSTSVTGATPSAYASTTKGTSSVAYGDNSSTGSINATAQNSTRGTTSSVNLSNLQSAFNATGTAQLDTPIVKIMVSETNGANLSSGITVNANSLTTSNTSNEASSVFLATSASSAFTGSVSVTNIQATKSTLTTSQLADVTDSVILADLRDVTAETTVSGTVSVNANTVSSKSMGNTAGARTSTGSIAVGNAIIFESSSDITGPTAPSALNTAASVHSSAITTTTTEGKADLLINSVQRNAGNEFKSTVTTSSINTKVDNLAAGSLAQNSNTQTATATANLAGNLINAGTSASVGNIKANAAVLNTQANSTVSSLASVTDSTQQVTVGISNGLAVISGSVTLTDNSILATAEGNAAASQLSLKASTLTVGANGTGLVDLKPAVTADATAVAGSGLAASVLSVQANDTLTLTSNNDGNTIAAKFNDQAAVAPVDKAITGSQVSVNNNAIKSTATANAASNANNLVATNAPGLNAGLGNSQRNTGSTVTAQAGFFTAVGVAIAADNVTGSNLSLNTNTLDATAKGNSTSNSLSVEATTATGLSAVTGGLFATLSPYSQAGDAASLTGGVQANADFALANAQLNNTGSLSSSVSGSAKITSAIVASSTLSATGNSLSGNTSVNSAGNTLGLSITNMTGMTAGLSSSQSVSLPAASVTSTATGTVSIGTGGAAVNTASSLNLNSNTTSSSVSANTVVNALNLTATTASGRDLTAGAATNSASTVVLLGVANASDDFALANQQKIDTGTFQATTAAATTVTSGAIDASSITVNANSGLASVSANRGTNSIALAVNNLSKPNTGLASSQLSSTSTFEATVDDGTLVLGTGYVGTTANNAQIAVTTNLLKATVLGNVVSNTLTLSGSQATGSTLPMADNTTTANGATGAITTYASAALANWQTSSGDTFAANVGGLASLPLIYLTAGNVTNTGTTRSTLSLSSNTLATGAYANDASNTLALSVTQMSSMTTALASGQSMINASTTAENVTAKTLGQVVLTAGTVTGLAAASNTLTANSNVIGSTARVNNVSNTQQLRGEQFTGQTTLVPAFGASASSVVTAKSDLSLANVQRIRGAGFGAAAATTGDVSMIFDNLNYANASTNSNALTAYASGNAATNLSDVLVTGLNAASLGVVSAQYVDNYPVAATTTGDVKITANGGAANVNASLTLNANTLSATAIRNTADNTLTVQATNASGRGVASRQSLASTASTIVADYALGNIQTGANGATTATTASNVALNLGAFNATTSQLTVESNSLSAYASGNSASNQMTLAMNQLTQASAAVSSYQSGATGATTVGDFDGRVKLTVGTVDTVALSMKDNSIKATAIGNVAGNKLDVTANTATGTGTGSVAAVATSSTATVNADFAVTNVQSLTTLSNVTATTDGSINVETSSVTSSSLGLTGNSIASLAVGNSAGNTLLLNVAQQSGLVASTANGLTAAVSSSQTNDVTVSSTTQPKDTNLFGIQATTGVTTSTLTLSDNTASAVASKNEAFNTLTVSGANVFGRGGNVTGSVAGTSSVTGADFALINTQSASGATTADMTVGASGLSTALTGVGGAGTLTVSGNSVLASASANTTGNSLSLSATNLLEASAAINNVQSLAAAGTVSSSVLTGGFLSVETSAVAGSANVAVTGNLVKSSASANVATNALNATSSNGTLNAGSVTSPVGTTGTPTFAVLNSQSTGAGSSVTSTVTSFTMGGVQLSGALNSGGTASVTGNAIQSLAYGNSASNAIQLSALTTGLNTASASITNFQSNMASVSASVTGSSMQANGLNSTGTATVNMAGNTVVAMAVGNRAVNTITGR